MLDVALRGSLRPALFAGEVAEVRGEPSGATSVGVGGVGLDGCDLFNDAIGASGASAGPRIRVTGEQRMGECISGDVWVGRSVRCQADPSAH